MTDILRQKIGSGQTRTCSSTCHMATKDKCACITLDNDLSLEAEDRLRGRVLAEATAHQEWE